VADGVTPTHASLLTPVTQQPSGQLSLTKSGPSYAFVNSQLVYTLRCENTGDVTLSGLVLLDILPTGLPLLGASPTPNVATLPLLRWSLGDLAPGASRTVVITSTAPAAAGAITNTAVADAPQLPMMVLSTLSTQVLAHGAFLHVTKGSSPPSVHVGEQLVYTLQYWNSGDQSATGVFLTDTLPSGITVTAAYPPVTPLASPQLVWNLGAIGVTSPTRTIVITATVGGAPNRTLHNVADIAGQPGSYPDHAERYTEVRPFMLYLPIIMRQY